MVLVHVVIGSAIVSDTAGILPVHVADYSSLLKDSLQRGYPSIKDTKFGSKYCECIWCPLSPKDTSIIRAEFFGRTGVFLLEWEYCRHYLATFLYTSLVVWSSKISSRLRRFSVFSLVEIVVLNSCLKYLRENWYMGSTSAMAATTKYMTEPRVATTRYFSRAVEIFSSVVSASFSLLVIAPDVTCNPDTATVPGTSRY